MSRRIKNGMALPPEVVREIREMRKGGMSYHSIANQMNVSWSSVHRNCRDMPERKVAKMSNQERGALLHDWRPSLFTGWPEDGEPGGN